MGNESSTQRFGENKIPKFVEMNIESAMKKEIRLQTRHWKNPFKHYQDCIMSGFEFNQIFKQRTICFESSHSDGNYKIYTEHSSDILDLIEDRKFYSDVQIPDTAQIRIMANYFLTNEIKIVKTSRTTTFILENDKNYPLYESDPRTISYVESTPENRLLAIRLNGLAITRIEDPVYEEWVSAAYENGLVIKYLNKIQFSNEKIEMLDMIAILSNPIAVQYTAQTEFQCEIALRLDPMVLRYIKVQEEKYCIFAVRQNPKSIVHVKNQTQGVKWMAFRRDRSVYDLIESPPDSMKQIVFES